MSKLRYYSLLRNVNYFLKHANLWSLGKMFCLLRSSQLTKDFVLWFASSTIISPLLGGAGGGYFVNRRKIGDKLAVIFGLLIFAAILVCGWYIYGQTKHHLDQELGQRLIDIAQTIATHANGAIITQLVPGNETGLTYRNLVSQLNSIKHKTAVKRIYLFDANHRSLVDTEREIPIGIEYLKLKFDQLELERVWQKNGAASVLFLGDDGYYYKSGYAPILVNDKVVAAVGVDASATFLQILNRFRRNVFTFALACVIISVAIVFLVSKTITNQIHQLVAAAEKIGKGDFATSIKINSKDEIGYLGRTMEEMRLNILNRDEQMKLMLANVAHEIRNPLGGIELFAGILAEELGQNDPARAHLFKITKEVRKLNDVITEFLDFARHKEPQKRDVYLEELIQSAYFTLELEFEKAAVEFQAQVQPQELKVNVDPEQFKRVFINLFKNSLQAIQNSKITAGKLTVTSSQKDRMVEISVNDNGAGIPAENIPKLFEPFFTTKEKGAGLGLAIVDKIISDHGGSIDIQSTEGEFTKVIIRIFHSG
ncbi:HAMP domain-containing protein [Candidatus Poribacteria bacterium]|nr:HAMP domain-containing protein [Candidatus Poribacteria bacterium]